MISAALTVLVLLPAACVIALQVSCSRAAEAQGRSTRPKTPSARSPAAVARRRADDVLEIFGPAAAGWSTVRSRGVGLRRQVFTAAVGE